MGELSFGLFTLCSKSSEGSVVLGDVDAGFLLEVSHAVVDHLVIEVFPSEMGVAACSFDLEETLLNREEGNIKSTTTEIKYEN